MNGWGDTEDGGSQTMIAKSGDRRGFRIRTSVDINTKLQYPNIHNGRCCVSSSYSIGINDKDGIKMKEWHMLSFVYNNNKMYVYIDGKLSNISEENKFYIDEINTQQLQIGIGQSEVWYPYHGLIDNLRIYNRALNEKEIKELFINKD